VKHERQRHEHINSLDARGAPSRGQRAQAATA
jgi:hypothetical protein